MPHQVQRDQSEIVLRGGRVIDPETGLDEIRDVAVSGGEIAEVGTGSPRPQWTSTSQGTW